MMMMMLHLVALMSSFLWTTIAGGCVFPTDWHGSWYQGSFGDVVITSDTMTNKGVCVDSRGSNYLLKTNGYSMCLFITQPHANVIRYTESFVDDDQLPGDDCRSAGSPFYTLIREPSRPVKCPFSGAFKLDYNNNSGGFCRNPDSYVKSCASETQFWFRFRSCPDIRFTHNTEMHFECLATWSENNHRHNYMISRLRGKELATKEEIYRCFMYHVHGTLVYLAMSADASCRGLSSPSNGPSTMELTRDVSQWPFPLCRFPHWLGRTAWRDLGGRHVYQTSPDRSTVRLLARRDATTEPRALKAFRCATISQYDGSSGDQLSVLSFTSIDCAVVYTCLKFVRRRNDVIEIYEGGSVDRNTQRCSEMHLQDAKYSLLIPDVSRPVACPATGQYAIRTGSSVCSGYLRSGCASPTVLDITSSCSSRPGIQLECLKTWRSAHKRYVIARKIGDREGPANCFSFSFSRRSPTMQFALDEDCNGGSDPILRDAITYVVDYNAASCEAQRVRIKTIPKTGSDVSFPLRDQPGDEKTSFDRAVTDRGHARRLNTGELRNLADGLQRSQRRTIALGFVCALVCVLITR